MGLRQEQHEVFSTFLLKTICFSLPASHVYIVTVWALHKMQKFCHFLHPGQDLTARAVSWLCHGAAVAPKTTALCKGYLRRSCEKLCWRSPSLHLGAVGSSGPEATLQLSLCLAMYLCCPWLDDMTSWLDFGPVLLLQACVEVTGLSAEPGHHFVGTLQFWLGGSAPSLASEVITSVCHSRLLAHLPLWSSPSFAVP